MSILKSFSSYSQRHPVSGSRREPLLVERKPRVSTGTSAISIGDKFVESLKDKKKNIELRKGHEKKTLINLIERS